MASPPHKQFGQRRAASRLPDTPQPKRSRHVALLVMGTLAVGGGAYALMPGQSCQVAPAPGLATPAAPGMAAPAATPQPVACGPRSSSSSGSGGSGGSRLSFFGGSSSSGGSSSGGAESSSGVSRGGFGAAGHAFGSSSAS